MERTSSACSEGAEENFRRVAGEGGEGLGRREGEEGELVAKVSIEAFSGMGKMMLGILSESGDMEGMDGSLLVCSSFVFRGGLNVKLGGGRGEWTEGRETLRPPGVGLELRMMCSGKRNCVMRGEERRRIPGLAEICGLDGSEWGKGASRSKKGGEEGLRGTSVGEPCSTSTGMYMWNSEP